MTRFVLEEPVAGAGGFELVVGEDLERQVEAAVELVLPLLGEAAGADDEAALQVAAGDQLLDEQAGHDRLAGAGVVGEQEAQRLARQHRLVDGGDLVRQRLDQRGVDGQHRIEEVGEADRDQGKSAPSPSKLHGDPATIETRSSCRTQPWHSQWSRGSLQGRSQTTARDDSDGAQENAADRGKAGGLSKTRAGAPRPLPDVTAGFAWLSPPEIQADCGRRFWLCRREHTHHKETVNRRTQTDVKSVPEGDKDLKLDRAMEPFIDVSLNIASPIAPCRCPRSFRTPFDPSKRAAAKAMQMSRSASAGLGATR